MNPTALGVALIGAGMIAERHVTALSSMQGRARLLAVVSRHPDKARHLARHYDGTLPEFTSELSAVLQNEQVAFAIVATPPAVRLELIQSLASAGKHILLEKPVARNLEEATEVVGICDKAGVKLGVLFQNRTKDSARSAQRLLNEGTIGPPGHIEIAVPIWREQSYYDELGRGTYARDGGGVLITQAIHNIDLTLSLAGPVTRVQAMTATTPLHRMESEDLAVAGLQFASGAVGSLVASTATFPHGRESITLHCRHASLQLTSDKLVVSWRDGRIETLPGSSSEGATPEAIPKYVWHQRVIEDFVSAIRNQHDPLAGGDEALAAHRLIEAIEYSSAQGVAVDLDSHAAD